MSNAVNKKRLSIISLFCVLIFSAAALIAVKTTKAQSDVNSGFFHSASDIGVTTGRDGALVTLTPEQGQTQAEFVFTNYLDFTKNQTTQSLVKFNVVSTTAGELDFTGMDIILEDSLDPTQQLVKTIDINAPFGTDNAGVLNQISHRLALTDSVERYLSSTTSSTCLRIAGTTVDVTGRETAGVYATTWRGTMTTGFTADKYFYNGDSTYADAMELNLVYNATLGYGLDINGGTGTWFQHTDFLNSGNNLPDGEIKDRYTSEHTVDLMSSGKVKLKIRFYGIKENKNPSVNFSSFNGANVAGQLIDNAPPIIEKKTKNEKVILALGKQYNLNDLINIYDSSSVTVETELDGIRLTDTNKTFDEPGTHTLKYTVTDSGERKTVYNLSIETAAAFWPAELFESNAQITGEANGDWFNISLVPIGSGEVTLTYKNGISTDALSEILKFSIRPTVAGEYDFTGMDIILEDFDDPTQQLVMALDINQGGTNEGIVSQRIALTNKLERYTGSDSGTYVKIAGTSQDLVGRFAPSYFYNAYGVNQLNATDYFVGGGDIAVNLNNDGTRGYGLFINNGTTVGFIKDAGEGSVYNNFLNYASSNLPDGEIKNRYNTAHTDNYFSSGKIRLTIRFVGIEEGKTPSISLKSIAGQAFDADNMMLTDTEKPVITLKGGSEVSLITGDIVNLFDLFTVTDIDQSVEIKYLLDGAPYNFDTFTAGAVDSQYIITVTATDRSGNAATKQINISVISLNLLIDLSQTLILEIGYGAEIVPVVTDSADYSVGIFKANDTDFQNNLNSTDFKFNTLNAEYVLEYKVYTQGAVKSFYASAVVKDTKKPDITFLNGYKQSYYRYAELELLLADVSDNSGENINAVRTVKYGGETLSGSLDKIILDKTGELFITYIAQDSSGNKRETEFYITVESDSLAPTILVGGQYASGYVKGSEIALLGADVSDNSGRHKGLTVKAYCGDTEIDITDGKITLNAEGLYKVIYSAEDYSGNTESIEYSFISILGYEEDSDPPSDNDKGCGGCKKSSGTALPIMYAAIVISAVFLRKRGGGL